MQTVLGMNIELITNIVGKPAAEAVCQHYQSLHEIHSSSLEALQSLRGLGPSKALALKSALELARDLSREVLGESPVLDNPSAIADTLREEYRPHTTEVFTVLLLNTRKRLIKKVQIATGTLDTLLVHSREVFRHAIVCNAAAVVLSHGHPSGDPTPSEADIKVTRDLIRAGQMLRIEVLDHVILGRSTTERPKDYSSLRELGYFYQ